MKYISTLLLSVCLLHTAYSQEDLLKVLDEQQKNEPPKPEYTTNTFKAVRIVNCHSVELPAKRNFQFVIQHRFGNINEGWRNFFGIDKADMRIGLEYGIFKWWSAGWMHNRVGGTWDLHTRLKLLRQSTGAKKMPFTLVWYSNIGIISKDQPAEVKTVHRLSYAHQILLARKFTR